MVNIYRMTASSWFEAGLYVVNYSSIVITIYLAYLNGQDPASLIINGQSTQPGWLLAIQAHSLLFLGVSFFINLARQRFKSAFRCTRPIGLHVLFASANLLTPRVNPGNSWSFGSTQIQISCLFVFVWLSTLDVLTSIRNEMIALIRDFLVAFAWTPWRPFYSWVWNWVCHLLGIFVVFYFTIKGILKLVMFCFRSAMESLKEWLIYHWPLVEYVLAVLDFMIY